MSSPKRIASFTYKNVRYFMPDGSKTMGDANEPWSEERSQAMIVDVDERPTKTEYTSNANATVEYDEEE